MFGVGTYIVQRHSSEIDAAIVKTRQLGAHWVREEFTATRLHADAQGRYWWGPYDAVVNRERKAGLHILGLIDYSNTWGLGDHGAMPHDSIGLLSSDYSSYAAAVARHFRGRIRYWEIWNEPNLSQHWHPRANAGDYAILLDSAAAAIKYQDPRAKVVLGGTSGMDFTFLRSVARKTSRFDVISVHPYRSEPEEHFLREVAALKSLGKPIWFSEMGWPGGGTCPVCILPAEQATLLVRFYFLSAAAGVDRVFWYDLVDDARALTPQELHFGLFGRDLSPKSSAVAYSRLARILRHARFVAAQESGRHGLYVLRFVRAGRELAAVWNVGLEPASVHMSWNSSTAYVGSLDSATIEPIEISDRDVALTVQPDGRPLVVVERASALHEPVFPILKAARVRSAPKPSSWRGYPAPVRGGRSGIAHIPAAAGSCRDGKVNHISSVRCPVTRRAAARPDPLRSKGPWRPTAVSTPHAVHPPAAEITTPVTVPLPPDPALPTSTDTPTLTTTATSTPTETPTPVLGSTGTPDIPATPEPSGATATPDAAVVIP